MLRLLLLASMMPRPVEIKLDPPLDPIVVQKDREDDIKNRRLRTVRMMHINILNEIGAHVQGPSVPELSKSGLSVEDIHDLQGHVKNDN